MWEGLLPLSPLLADMCKAGAIPHFPLHLALVRITLLVWRSVIDWAFTFLTLYVEFQVVIADGSLVTANEVSNPDRTHLVPWQFTNANCFWFSFSLLGFARWWRWKLGCHY